MSDAPDLDYEVLETSGLDRERRALLQRLFASNYDDADPEFVERSLATLGRVALAYAGERPIGFALGETRRMDLPGLPDQVVQLAGLCCIDPDFRRLGLFGDLTGRTMDWTPDRAAPRSLFCGRVAHPAAFRTIARMAGTIPRPCVRPTRWQQQIGSAIAAAYRVFDFDPETFVCIGRGRPVGIPRLHMEIEPAEWEAFASVNRDRGDALLALAWFPEPPPGW